MTQPLDQDAAALLARMGADFADAPADPTVAERRQALLTMARAYGPEPAPVASMHDQVLKAPGRPIRVRVYRPLDGGRRPPIIVHIHGGGWVLGDPDSYEQVCRAYCSAAGAIVVDVDYRRAPEDRYPAALKDCEAALDWVHAHAREIGGDPARIVVTGDSAGGNLAAALCQRTRVPVALQVLVYPVLSASPSADFPSRRAFGDGSYFLREFDIKRAETEYLPRPEDGDQVGASPLLASHGVLAKAPPALIITAGLDPLVDEAAAYAERLRAAGVPVEYLCFGGTIHGFVLFAGALAKGRAAIERIGDAVRALPARKRGLVAALFGG